MALQQFKIIEPKYFVFAQVPGHQFMFACTNAIEVKKSFESIKASIDDVRIYLVEKIEPYTTFEEFEKVEVIGKQNAG